MPLLCGSRGKGTFELQGRLVLSLPPPSTWSAAVSPAPSPPASAAAFGSVELAAEAAAEAGGTLEEEEDATL